MDSISKTDRVHAVRDTPTPYLPALMAPPSNLYILSLSQPRNLINMNPIIWIQSLQDCDTNMSPISCFHIFQKNSFPYNCTSPRCQMHLGTLQTSTNSKLFTFNVLLANKVLLVYFHQRKIRKKWEVKNTFHAAFLYCWDQQPAHFSEPNQTNPTIIFEEMLKLTELTEMSW